MTARKPTCVACKGAGGEATYTAGTGIVIESNEISADTSVLATKTEIPDMDDYQPKLTAGTGITIDADNVISATGGTLGEFTLLNDTDWTSCLYYDSSTYEIKALKDVVISINYNGQCYNHYFPKGSYRFYLSFALIDNNGEIAYAKIDSSNITGDNIAGKYLAINITENQSIGTISISKIWSTLNIKKNHTSSPNVKLYYRE